jgi:hypothetical protein
VSTAALTRAEMLAAAEFTPDEFGVFTAGYVEGYAAGVAVTELDYQLHLGVAKSALSLPLLAELERRRTVDHQPCAMKCRRCSRCVHSLAYYGRGGRDFLGIEAERELAAKEAAA